MPGLVEMREDCCSERIQTAQDASITTNSSGAIVSWSAEAENIFGYRKDEILDRPFTVLVPQGFHKKHLEAFNRFLKNTTRPEEENISEGVGVHKNGSEFFVAASSAIRKSGQDVFFTVVIREITERRRIVNEHESFLMNFIMFWKRFFA